MSTYAIGDVQGCFEELGQLLDALAFDRRKDRLWLVGDLAKPRPDDTLDEVLAAPDRAELIEWLRGLPMIHVEREHVLVHAGLLPQWSVQQAQGLGREVEAALRGPRHREFLTRLYGGKPDRWDDALRDADRLRVIVNAMTRMRFCTEDGVMEFQTKGEAAEAPPGYTPWFDVPGRRSAD